MKKHQRGYIVPIGMGSASTELSGGAGGTIVQVDGIASYDSTVGIRFNVNGTIETALSINGAGLTWSPAGGWITPLADASSVFDVRFTNFNGASGGDWSSEATADDVWITLVDGVRTYTMNSTVQEDISFTCDFEVRDGGGAPPATGSSSYTFRIQNTV